MSCDLCRTLNSLGKAEDPVFLPCLRLVSALEKRLLWRWIFRGIGSGCTGNLRRKLTCYIFFFIHAKLFPGTEHGGCLFIPLCGLHLALLFVALLLTNRPKNGETTAHTLLCWWIKTSSFNSRVNCIQLQSKLHTQGILFSQAVELYSCQETNIQDSVWISLSPPFRDRPTLLPGPLCGWMVVESTEQMLSFSIYSSLEKILEAQVGKMVLDTWAVQFNSINTYVSAYCV